MFCSSIEEYSLLYMEDELDSKAKGLLLKHIGRCDQCRRMFKLIKANYHGEEKVAEKSFSLSETISAHIDKGRYPVSKNILKPFSWKKVLVVSMLIFTLLIFASVNAKTIYKTYHELVRSMFIDGNLLGRSFIHTGTYSDEGYVKSVYEKYESEVEALAEQMKTAEISRLKYDVDGKTFRVQIAKGIKGNFIMYGFEGYTIFHNDFSEHYFLLKSETISNHRTEYPSADDLLGAAGIAPAPGYIPTGYHFMQAYLSEGSGGSVVPESLGLAYRKDGGESLSIALTRSKMAIINGNAPENLKAAAGLSETGPQPAPENGGSAALPPAVQEALAVGEYQAVYTEENILNPEKDGMYRTFRIISVFLGDRAKLPILRIESASLDKEELMKVAVNVEIANLSENQRKTAEYFQGIEDEKILAYTNRYLDNINAGKTEFKFEIDEDTEFYKLGYNDVYYIKYRNVGVDKIKSVISPKINLKEELLKRFESADIQILGRPYSAEKTYGLSLMVKKYPSLSIYTEKSIKPTGDLELTDEIIAGMSGAQDEAKPLFSSSGHLYYLIGPGGTGPRILRTMYEADGMVYGCNFMIYGGIMKDEQAVMDFINGL